MKLIVGLGNPGEKYKNNRHNVGHMFLDYLVDSRQSSVDSKKTKFVLDKYLLSYIYKINTNDQRPTTNDLILAKPNTYMNKSGEAVKLLVDKYLATSDLPAGRQGQRPATNDLIVVHDDLDIPLGKFRIVKGYGPKLHNGIESIENKLLAQNFTRVRIGVDNRTPENRMPGIDYVLQDFGAEEINMLPNTFSQILSLLQSEKHIAPLHIAS